MTTAPPLLSLDDAAALVPGATADTLKRQAPVKKGIGFDVSAMIIDRHAWIRDYLRRTVRTGKGRTSRRTTRVYAISAEFMIALAEKQNFRYAVTGIEFERPVRGGRAPFAPSIDRIDNSRGYEPDNVRLVCLIVNLARSNFPDDALVKMARAIVERYPL